MPSWEDLEKLARKVNNDENYEKLNIGIDFASKLIKARQKHNLTQSELAELAGLTQSAIARIENHGSFPRLDTIYKIANAIDSNLDFYPNNNDLTEQSSNVDKLNEKLTNLEKLVKDLLIEVQSLRKQNKRPFIILPPGMSFSAIETYKSRISTSTGTVVDELPIYATLKGGDTYARKN